MEHHSHQDAVITTGEHGRPLTSPPWRAAWSTVIALGLTTIISYGMTQYLFLASAPDRLAHDPAVVWGTASGSGSATARLAGPTCT